MTAEITLVTVFHNGVHALKLMWRSYNFHNPDPTLFWAFDNNSSDGSEDYAIKMADQVTRHSTNYGHAHGLNELCPLVTTPYVLIVDSDVEFTAPVSARMADELKNNPSALCVSYPSHEEECVVVKKHGITMTGKKRINPCCAMFNTENLKPIMRHTGFECCFGERYFYDVGGMLYKIGTLLNLKVLEPQWIRESVTHYIGIGTLQAGWLAGNEVLRQAALDRYAAIEQRSRLYPEPNLQRS